MSSRFGARYWVGARSVYNTSKMATLSLLAATEALVTRIASSFSRGSWRAAVRVLLTKHLRQAAESAETVQIIGMDRPVSIFDIYQPSRVVDWTSADEVPFMHLVEHHEDAVIYAGPGSGKTVLMQYAFATLAMSPVYLPVLFYLRWPGTVRYVSELVKVLAPRSKGQEPVRLLLLLDGFDEVPSAEQDQLSEALATFQKLKIGNYYLTCRNFHQVNNVKARNVQLASFSNSDARSFVVAFGKAYGAPVDANELIEELEQHGFADFAAHPLMLAMICILKSGPMPQLPRHAIGLIRRAIDTLTFRWDESRGIARESRFSIDGEDRVRCMMRVAFRMNNLVAPTSTVDRAVREHLELLQRPQSGSLALLREIAQWYGMLVPVSEREWALVHRTIHDFLAARYWVETGAFNPHSVQDWNARAAYAASLLPDATSSLVAALKAVDDISAFSEALFNGALFSTKELAPAVNDHFARTNATSTRREHGRLIASTTKDFFGHASDEFLRDIIADALTRNDGVSDGVLAYTLVEVRQRRTSLSPSTVRSIRERFGNSAVLQVTRGRGIFSVVISELGKVS